MDPSDDSGARLSTPPRRRRNVHSPDNWVAGAVRILKRDSHSSGAITSTDKVVAGNPISFDAALPLAIAN